MIYFNIMKALLIILLLLLLYFLYRKYKNSKKTYTIRSKLKSRLKSRLRSKVKQKLSKKVVQKEVIINKEAMQPYIERFEKAWESVGNLNRRCPYCDHKFDKMPQSKRKCPSCKETIYPRVIPQSKEKSLLRLEDIPVLNKQKSAITYITIHTSKKEPEYQKAYKKLEKKFGFKPRENDVLWRLFNERILQTTIDQDFGLLRNAYLEAAEILREEKKFLHTLLYHFYVCYLDINGADNGIGQINKYGVDQQSLQKKFSSGLQVLLLPQSINLQTLQTLL